MGKVAWQPQVVYQEDQQKHPQWSPGSWKPLAPQWQDSNPHQHHIVTTMDCCSLWNQAESEISGASDPQQPLQILLWEVAQSLQPACVSSVGLAGLYRRPWGLPGSPVWRYQPLCYLCQEGHLPVQDLPAAKGLPWDRHLACGLRIRHCSSSYGDQTLDFAFSKDKSPKHVKQIEK